MTMRARSSDPDTAWARIRDTTRGIAARARSSLRVRIGILATSAIRKRLGEQLRQLDAAGFVIVANNCVAGMLYEFAGLEKRSPTAGLFFRDDAYPRFLAALSDGDLRDWQDIDPAILGVDETSGAPALIRNGRPAIVFLHYPDPVVAAHKWNARLVRMRSRKVIVLVSLRDGLDETMLEPIHDRYDDLCVISPAPTPPADAIVLDRRALAHISAFLGDIAADAR